MYQLFRTLFCVGSLVSISLFALDLERDASKIYPIIILPLDGSTDSSLIPINKQIVAELVTIATQTQRLKVYDRNQVETILKEHSLRLSQGFEVDTREVLNESTEAQYALKLQVTEFTQKGVPPEDYSFGEEVIAHLFDMENEFSDNIQTKLSFDLTLLDLLSNEVEYHYSFSESHVGGYASQSWSVVEVTMRETLRRELINLFKIESLLEYDQFGNLIFRTGEGLDVEVGSYFYLTGSGVPKIIGDDTTEAPTLDYGLAQIVEKGPGWARLDVLRSWDEVDGPYYAQERTQEPTAVVTSVQTSVPHSFNSTLLDLQFSPMANFTGILRFQMGRPHVERSLSNRTGTAFGFGMGFGGGYALRLGEKFTLRPQVFGDFWVFNRTDDERRSVTAFVFSTPIYLDAEIHISKHWSLVPSVGYRTWGRTADWTYSSTDKDDEVHTEPAKWSENRGGAPQLETNGVVLRLGINYLFL